MDRTAARDGLALDLSVKELTVLQILLEADGKAVTAQQLLERAWDAQTDPFSGVVGLCVGKLGEKLGDPALIRTVDADGGGYVL